jgi:uncharacterized protein with FMN-binding domain
MELAQKTTVRVTAADPASASVDGQYSGSMRTNNGDVIKVNVSIHKTGILGSGERRN